MDSYIVRIYRRDQAAPECIVGTIEFVANQEVKPFKTVWELTEILAPARRSPKQMESANDRIGEEDGLNECDEHSKNQQPEYVR